MHHRSSHINPITQTASARVVFSGKDYSGASLSVSVPQNTESSTGKKKFELTNHLGNVLAIIGDRKQKSQQSPQHQAPEVVNLTDYYPFGMVMPGRSYAADVYRYAFNGMEKDDEIKGSGNSYTAAFWEYDPRIGRRSNVDPITYAFHGGYTSLNNNPISFIDPDGLYSERRANRIKKRAERRGYETGDVQAGEGKRDYSVSLYGTGEDSKGVYGLSVTMKEGTLNSIGSSGKTYTNEIRSLYEVDSNDNFVSGHREMWSFSYSDKYTRSGYKGGVAKGEFAFNSRFMKSGIKYELLTIHVWDKSNMGGLSNGNYVNRGLKGTVAHFEKNLFLGNETFGLGADVSGDGPGIDLQIEGGPAFGQNGIWGFKGRAVADLSLWTIGATANNSLLTTSNSLTVSSGAGYGFGGGIGLYYDSKDGQIHIQTEGLFKPGMGLAGATHFSVPLSPAIRKWLKGSVNLRDR